VPDRLQQPAVVEPVDPLQGGVLDLVEAFQGRVDGSARSCTGR
jgi:hypothetical protein